MTETTKDAERHKSKMANRKAAQDAEAAAVAEFTKLNAADTERQAKAGIQVIKFDDAGAKKFYDEAYAAGWEGVIRQSPEHGPKLKGFFSK